MHKPLAPFSPRKFYKPKYLTKQTDDTQLRTTIDWESNIRTSSSGSASFSFYTADRPGTYTVIIEGSDMDGNLGERCLSFAQVCLNSLYVLISQVETCEAYFFKRLTS